MQLFHKVNVIRGEWPNVQTFFRTINVFLNQEFVL